MRLKCDMMTLEAICREETECPKVRSLMSAKNMELETLIQCIKRVFYSYSC